MDYYCNFSFLNQTSVGQFSNYRTKIKTLHQALLPKCSFERVAIVFCDWIALRIITFEY